MADSSLENASETVTNATAEKIPASPEGMLLAYGALFSMAVISIYIGSLKSIKYHKKQQDSGEKVERMTGKDAALFPIIASCFLLGIYIIFQMFSKEYVNMLLSSYFLVLGILALAHIAGPFLKLLIPAAFPNSKYHFKFTEGEGESMEEHLDCRFDRKDLMVLAICSMFGVWYIYEKHWIANNVLGLAFAINGIEILQLNTVMIGCILLGGLFFYDIFWVFGTDVMVTVAKSFDAPIKLVFPQDLLENWLEAKNFAMLGLGDIVIPGIFVAILLRYDCSRGKDSKFYFYSCYFAYILGLGLTIFVMHYFKHAQPALLYLVPCCIIIPVGLALVKGDLKTMFEYEDNPEPVVPTEETTDKKDD
ncbi:minor histocompatibility antigen H13-like [Watersipora subatra]|uniref:minor histocompatibility antigen H13-like n=1 Tax=Watersipora subatra TaxID=2589382 RepID=UPI00355B3F5A